MSRLQTASLVALLALLAGCRETVDLTTVRPGPDGKITWQDAERVLLHPDVEAVTQHHSRELVITMKGGTEYRTIQPRIDQAWHLIKEHGLEDRISYATE